MAHSKSLRSYADAKEVFDAAIAQNGLRVTCRAEGQAVHLRSRLNHFRVLDRQLMSEVFPPDDPRHGISAYDPYVIRLVGSTLIIEPRGPADYTLEPLHPTTEPRS